MWNPARRRFLNLLLLAFILFPTSFALTLSAPKEARPKDEVGPGVSANSADLTADQATSAQGKPEIVLQAGITSPQAQIGFSPDGRLLASMGMNGNAIKLWEVASGRLLRQLDSGIPSMGASSLKRPFRFSADGRTLIAMADGRIRRWEVETGRELEAQPLVIAKP